MQCSRRLQLWHELVFCHSTAAANCWALGHYGKNMKLLYKDYCWDAEIYWSKPYDYVNFSNGHIVNEESAYFYIIFGQYSKFSRKIFYIGKTYDQYIQDRIIQKDHKDRIQKLQLIYPRFKFYLSIGKIKVLNGKITRKRIDQIESLLIFSCNSNYLKNKNKIFSLRLNDHYKIINHGYYKPLPNKLVLGLFT